MKDRPQKRETEQLHTGSAPVELEEYSLEEIMREFGGWSDWSGKDTGLTPAAPENADEAEALSSIMAIHCPPSATWKDQASAQSPDVHAHPSGAHSPQRNTPAFHPAKGTDRNHPAQGHNP